MKPITYTQSAAERPQSARWLNRNVVGMALASFFSDAGHEMATAVLPMFLIAIGAPAFALGTIEGVADAISSFVKLGAGWFSDRVGRRKPIAVTGYFLTGITTGLFALTVTWPQVLLARAAGWFGRGIRGPVRDAMLAESVPAEARGRAFGFHRMGDTLGAIIGPVIALLLVSLVNGQVSETTYRVIFVVTLVPGLLSAFAFWFFVKEKRRQSNHDNGLLTSFKLLPRKFRLYLVGVGLFGMGDFAHSLLTLQAVQMLTPTLGAAEAGQVAIMLYVIHNVLYAGMAFPIGALADRVSKREVLAGGYALAAVMGIGWMIAVPSAWYLALLFAVGGSFIAAEDTLEGALAADLLPEEVRGTGYGVLATVNSLGDFVSSVVVGLLWSIFAPAVGFAYSVILSVAGAIVIWRVR